MIPLIWGTENEQFTDTESSIEVTGGWRRQKGELLFNGHRIDIGDDEKALGIYRQW